MCTLIAAFRHYDLQKKMLILISFTEGEGL